MKLALIVIMLVGGCHKADLIDQLVDRMNETADETCECKSLPCAMHAKDELERWENDRPELGNLTPTAEQNRGMDAAQKRILGCAAKLLPDRGQ